MADIAEWKALADDNNLPVPDGFPEGMAPSGLNNAARETMAAVRRWYDTAEWIDPGDIPAFLSANSFTLSGDRTDIYQVDRRIRLFDSGAWFYGTVSSAAVSGSVTTVAVDLDAGQLSNGLARVAVGIAGVVNRAIDRRSLGLGAFTTESVIDTPYIASGAVTAEKLHVDVHTYERLNRVNIAGASDVRFETEISPAFSSYLILLESGVTAAQADINMRFSVKGGATYIGSGYQYAISARDASGADLSSGNQIAFHIPIVSSPTGILAGQSVQSRIELTNLSSSALFKFAQIRSCYFSTNGHFTQNDICAAYSGSIDPVDAIRIDATPGVFSSGYMTLFGRRA